MRSLWRHGFRPVTILLISLLFVSFGDINTDPDSSNPYRGQPRITTKDGHITIETGVDKDILFKSSGRGTIKVNGDDLQMLVSAAKATNGVQNTPVLANLTARVAALENSSSTAATSQSDRILMDELKELFGAGMNAQMIRNEIIKVGMLENQIQAILRMVGGTQCNGTNCPPLPIGGDYICGGLYTELSGVIQSPLYPLTYPRDIICNYTIRVPVGKIIILEFQDFRIEGSENCIFDYLLVDTDRGPLQSAVYSTFYETFNRTANVTNRLCGHHLPLPLMTRYNELHLQFRTDGSVQNPGFKANYSALDMGCGGVLTELTGSFASPNYPNSYPPMTRCNWLIKAPEGLIIRLTFSVFNLEGQAQCNFDYIQVLDSDRSKIGKFCGNQAPPPVQSTANEMLVIFRSDDSRANDGFAASYVFVNESSNCGNINLFGEVGYIRSPGFPRFYPPLKDCIWVINAENGHQINFNVTSFDIENHTNCDYDFLELRNGGEATSPLVGKFCGTNIPKQWISHSNKFWIRFKTDSVMTGSGFEIRFDSASRGCGGLMTAPSGIIESPNYPQPYGHNAECNWLITVSRGTTVTLNFLEVDIESHHQCQYDHIEVFDGDSALRPSFGRICHKQSPVTINSSSNKIFIRFKSDGSQSGRGFRLNYGTNCTSVLKGYSGIIESPNYPNPYPSNINCNWTINVPVGNNITFNFTHLQLENGTVCQNDYLEILERTPPRLSNMMGSEWQTLKKYCGHYTEPPEPFNSTTRLAKVSFHTDTFLAYAGFRLEWKANGCGGEIINQLSGTITSPNYPNGYPPALGCLWHIRAKVGQVITLTVVDLDMEGATNCYFDYLKVFSGPDDNSPELLSICHKISRPVTVVATANEMTLKLYSDRSVTGKGFMAVFNIEEGGCSYIASNVEKGLITSPNYPSQYEPPTDCMWNVTISPLHIIEFTIDDINIPSGVDCNHTFLAIYDGIERDPLKEVKRICGPTLDMNTPIPTKSNNAIVVLRDGGNNPGRGFKIRYRAKCGGTILIGPSETGIFTSPNYPHGSVITQHCNWTFTALRMEDKVTISFNQLFALGTDPNACTGNNRIVIIDGEDPEGPETSSICTNITPKPFVSTGQTIQVRMIGTSVFEAVYSTVMSSCGGKLISDSGYLVSPGYPLGYPSDSECSWEITAPKGNKVSFAITDLRLQMTPACENEFLELREDGPNGSPLGRYCGTQIPSFGSNSTMSNKLWVKFKSVSGYSSGGFEMRYKMMYGGVLNSDSGVIESPGFATGLHISSAPAIWKVITSDRTRIRISLQVLDIPSGMRSGCSQSVRVHDGPSENSPAIGEFCGIKIPDPVTTSSNTATITFRYDSQDSFRGKFRLSWTTA